MRGEDIPFWVNEFEKKGKKAIGFTGEDLYKEFCLREKTQKLKVLRRVNWDDPTALFKKPTLCLIGPKDKTKRKKTGVLKVCVSSKYKNIAREYLKKLEKKTLKFKEIYVEGCVELSCSEGIADLIIDIVYTGNSLRKYNLEIYGKIMQSDFLILANRDMKESYINQVMELNKDCMTSIFTSGVNNER